jgi:hypothetical protein
VHSNPQSTDLPNSRKQVAAPRALILDISELRKGIDNYRIDVRISAKFTADVRRLATSLLNEAINPQPPKRDFDAQVNALRASYLDMMTVLIHRLKTDFDTSTVRLLELAAIKQALMTTRSLLDEQIDALKEKSGGKKSSSAANSLGDHQRLFLLQKNYDRLLFTTNAQVFSQLERVESRKLRELRQQYLATTQHHAQDILLNPMLLTPQPNDASFLIERHRLWGGDSEDAGFNAINRELESIIKQRLEEYTFRPLYSEGMQGTPELYDDLGGLFQTQKFMGLAADMKLSMSEEFDWLDIPSNLHKFFDLKILREELTAVRKERGVKAWWEARKSIKESQVFLEQFSKILQKRGTLALMIASKEVKKIWTESLAGQIEAKILCHFLCGNIDTKRLQARTLNNKTFSSSAMNQFATLAKKIKKDTNTHSLEYTFNIIQDISHFRSQLKYYRFAHRAFNRINLLKTDNDLALSKQAGTLYTLLTASEKEDHEDRIVHHSVIKADVRGSTTVTQELQNRNLNPASYFSLRFFEPINKLLPLYGANKVFIEGDALILSFLEYEKIPQQWFSVARACGLAKAILNIVSSNNLYSEQMELPNLELGIGLCYEGSAPHYLYDEDKPITISSAIGKADRLSSCTWKLRETLNPKPFNVEVYNLDEGEQGHGEKGQTKIRYNVNGVLLDNEGFEKLQQEVALTKLVLNINEKNVTLHIGRYPDLRGKLHDLVIREGNVGLWKNDMPMEDHSSDERFYEVVTNRKLISQAVTTL